MYFRILGDGSSRKETGNGKIVKNAFYQFINSWNGCYF